MKLLTSAQNKVIIRNECSFAHFDDLVRSVDNNKTDPKQKKRKTIFEDFSTESCAFALGCFRKHSASSPVGNLLKL